MFDNPANIDLGVFEAEESEENDEIDDM